MLMMRVGSRLRAVMGILLGVLALVLVLGACSTKESDSKAATSSSVTKTSTSATKTVTPTSSGAPQANPGGQGAGGGGNGGYYADPTAPESPYYHSPEAPAPGGTDNCNENCGVPTDDNQVPTDPEHCTKNPGSKWCGHDHEVKCTDKIDYTGDPRSNAEINLLGEQNGGTCPAPIKDTPTATATTTVAPTTTVTTSPPAATSTAVTTSEAPAATTSAAK